MNDAGPGAAASSSSASPSTKGDADPGAILPDGATSLPDGTALTIKVEPGDAEFASEHWVVYRDAQRRLRARQAALRAVPLGHGGVTLSLGDRATSGDWEIRWIAVREGMVTFEATHQRKRVDEWKAVVARRQTHEVASSSKLLHFEVTLASVTGDLELPGATITITGDAIERATKAAFGRSLKPGLYVFPDGLRLHVEQIANCDFDTSVPCFGGTYRAQALKGKDEARIEWRTKTTKLLAYTLALANGEFSVRK